MRRKAIQKAKRSQASKHIKGRNKKTRTIRDTPGKDNKLFNFGMSLKDNYKNLNITYDMNVINKLPDEKKPDQKQKKGKKDDWIDVEDDEPKQHIEVEEEYTLDQIRKANKEEGTFAKAKPKITEDEAIIIEKLVKKYGDNWERMKMDIKTNVLQWNENQIRKKHDAYLQKFGDPLTQEGRLKKYPKVKFSA
mmetsp:Transcript_39355/g.45775  ORF Transcript_39355/g.45775 Transcript_39355/m.45775 type:complete len:192 (-) Transcript_39355:94-669(-)